MEKYSTEGDNLTLHTMSISQVKKQTLYENNLRRVVEESYKVKSMSVSKPLFTDFRTKRFEEIKSVWILTCSAKGVV